MRHISDVTITGRTALDYISTEDLSAHALKSIGKLIMYIIDNILPTTPYPDIFKIQCKHEKECVRKFGQQLYISDAIGLDRFCVPALSILINRELNPHYDSMNPTDPDHDNTFSLNLQIPKSFIPPNQHILYPDGIPLCIVLYKRKALYHYCKRMKAIDNYKNVKKYPGRQKLVDELMKVNQVWDYIGKFFSREKRNDILSQFGPDTSKKPIFKGKMLVCNEAIDKMVS